MKRSLLASTTLLFVFINITVTHGQVGIGTTAPNSSAVLDLTSANKGFLPPRMTGQQRDSIPNPTPGLMVWCSNCGNAGQLNIYNAAGAWTTLTGDTAAAGAKFVVGAPFLGGIVAYVLQDGDDRYVPGEQHCLIASISDSLGAPQKNGSPAAALTFVWQQSTDDIYVDAFDPSIGGGLANTQAINAAFETPGKTIPGQPTKTTYNYAAYVATQYSTGGKSWYLPSAEELVQLYNNRVAIGGFYGQTKNPSTGVWSGTIANTYWSSTAEQYAGNDNRAMGVNFANPAFKNITAPFARSSAFCIRMVKFF